MRVDVEEQDASTEIESILKQITARTRRQADGQKKPVPRIFNNLIQKVCT